MRPRLADAALSELTLCQYTVLMRGAVSRLNSCILLMLPYFYKIYSGFQHTMKENRKLMER